jgi:hypothetical protein
MKTIYLGPLFAALLIGAGNAAPPDSGRDDLRIHQTIPTGAVGDGFILRGPDAMVIRNGVMTKVNPEIVLSNGLRVSASGDVTMRDGSQSALQAGRLLTFEGKFVDLPREDAALAGATNAKGATKAAGAEVGISDHDGISISGTDVLITRNGVTDRVKADVRLPNGVIAKADGTVVMANGDKIILRPDQVLDLKGVLHDAPVRENASKVAPLLTKPAK